MRLHGAVSASDYFAQTFQSPLAVAPAHQAGDDRAHQCLIGERALKNENAR